MMTTTFMMDVLRFSYLHSHRGQYSCSFPLSFSASFGRITVSQLLNEFKKQKQKFLVSIEPVHCNL